MLFGEGGSGSARRSMPALVERGLAGLAALCLALAVVVQTPLASEAGGIDSRFAGGSPRVLTGAGAWSWFESPRAIITDCELLAGSVASGTTADGATRSGDIDVTTLDLSTGTLRVDTLAEDFQVDDHDSPALVELPGGKILASYSKHHTDTLVRHAVRPANLTHWINTAPTSDPGRTTYANLSHLEEEGSGGTTYNFYRGTGFDPAVLRSTDDGRSWTRLGPLLRKFKARPYVVYEDDGSTRIDLATTEGHPREFEPGTGVFHGYVENGFLRNTKGHAVGTISYGAAPDELTRVWLNTPDQRAWTADIQQVPGGSPVIAFTVRDESDAVPTHQRNTYHYATWNGSAWQTFEIGFAGNSLYDAEIHYTGGIVIDPADPNHVVLSTDVHPLTGVPLAPAPGSLDAKHEMFDGVTTDGGSTWTFTPITSGSTQDNLRPVIPEPSPTARALLWFRGTYSAFSIFSTEVVGIVEGGGREDCDPPMQLEGAVPFTGDFDGDGLDDYFHYRPGPTPDTVFWGDGDRTVVSVNGTYQPLAYRSAGASQDGIIWSNPKGTSYRWNASGHQFASTAYNVEPGSIPLIGDYDGDGLDDIFHYRPGSGTDIIRYGTGGSRTLRVNGTYRPLVGDFDGDGRSDVLWYAPGTAPDYYWLFRSANPTSIQTRIHGHYQTAVGPADGDGTDDIFWLLADGSGYIWHHDKPFGPPQHTSIFHF